MNITLYLIAIFTFLLGKTNKKHGVIKDKIQYLNYFLLVLLLLLSGYSLNTIIWTLVHSTNLVEYIKDYEYMPQWLNLTMWIILQVVDFISVLIVYYVVQRKEKARLYLIKILPILAITFLYDSIRESYELITTTNAPLYIIVSILFLGTILPYMIIYYFYSREFVKNKLFIS